MPVDGRSRLWSGEMLVSVGFVMLLLTALQGWGMVGVIVLDGQNGAALLAELKRLHNLGLAGGFLAVCSGLTLILLLRSGVRGESICRILLPSLLIAPIAFCDRILAVIMGLTQIPFQFIFYALQAASALGITIALTQIVVSLFQSKEVIGNR
jgi:hypothetical protein